MLNVAGMNIDVAICAFRRTSILETLDSIAKQAVPGNLNLHVIVAENDEQPDLRDVIVRHAAALGLDLHYVHAPARNISIARNACLDAAQGDLLLFIDDDEIADPDWVGDLVAAWRATGAHVVFGPVIAVYPTNTPSWMRENNFHSTIPTSNHGVVETGISGNVLLDRRDPRVCDARFDLTFGRTGGEDVDFFFRLHHAGVPMAIAPDAVVHEPVAPTRLSFGWVLRRRHTTGAIYGACVAPDSALRRLAVLAQSAAKASYCGLRVLMAAAHNTRRHFWIMRASFHVGVVSGCISRPHREFYGGSTAQESPH